MKQTDNPLDENGYPIYGAFSPKKQTAVEWLVNQLQEGRATFFKLNDKEERIITLAGKDVLEQAKAMEKEQMLDFANKVTTERLNESIYTPFNLEQYYNEIYNK